MCIRDRLKALPNVKGIIINGGPNNVIDGVAIDVNQGIYEMGTPVMLSLIHIWCISVNGI